MRIVCNWVFQFCKRSFNNGIGSRSLRKLIILSVWNMTALWWRNKIWPINNFMQSTKLPNLQSKECIRPIWLICHNDRSAWVCEPSTWCDSCYSDVRGSWDQLPHSCGHYADHAANSNGWIQIYELASSWFLHLVDIRIIDFYSTAMCSPVIGN